MLKRLVLYVQRLSWPISRKLWVSFAIVLLLFVTGGAIVFGFQLRLAELDSEETVKARLFETLQGLRSDLKAQTNLYADTVFITNQRVINEDYGGQIANTLLNLNSKRAELGSEGAAALTEFASSYRYVITNLGELRDYITNGAFGRAQQEWPTYSQFFRSASDSLEKLYDIELQQRTNIARQKSDLIQLNLIVIIASLVLTFAIGSALAWLFSRCIGQPLKDIQVYLDKVAAGELAATVQVANRDELGRLAQILNIAIANLRQVISGTRVSENLKDLVQNLHSSTHQQSSGSTEQLYSVKQIIATMQELTHRAQQISNSATNVAEASNYSAERTTALKTVAEQGGEIARQVHMVVNDTITNVADAGATVNKLTEKLAQLTSSAKEISSVVALIDTVANEVHLLALNAAIEAAGAGAYGDRFRVVAGEIRNLANRTKASTRDISTMIESVQTAITEAQTEAELTNHKTRTVVQANQRLEEAVGGMNAIVHQTIEVVADIYDSAQLVDNQVVLIRQATEEQMTSSVQVNEALRTIGRMAQDNVTVSQQIAASTNNLDDISTNLVKLLAGISLA